VKAIADARGAVMRRLRAGILCAAIAAYAALPACADSWRSYHNTRFGATAAVPADWTMGPPPENDDGRVFISPDKRAQITISGIRALDSVQEEMAGQAKPFDGETISYLKRGNGWLVASGTKGEEIFYRKSILTCHNTILNHIYILYPKSDKAKYDKLVAHVSASLHAGGGVECY
jgi:serine/threonine-protein kinase